MPRSYQFHGNGLSFWISGPPARMSGGLQASRLHRGDQHALPARDRAAGGKGALAFALILLRAPGPPNLSSEPPKSPAKVTADAEVLLPQLRRDAPQEDGGISGSMGMLCVRLL